MKFTPNITAKVALLPTSEGGRKGATPPDVFGCPISVAGELFDMRMDLSGVGPVQPGTSVEVRIGFLRPELVMPLLHRGDRFTLWEGRTIGIGDVLQIHGKQRGQSRILVDLPLGWLCRRR